MSDIVDTPERLQLHAARIDRAEVPAPRDSPDGPRTTETRFTPPGDVANDRVLATLDFWRTHPQTPRPVRALLTAENTFGPLRAIAREQVPSWFTALLAGYGQAARRLSLPPRGDILWKWCRFHIRTTAYRWQRPTTTLAALMERLTDVKLGLVLFNALIDDIADVLRDRDLLAVFLRIPIAGGEFGLAADVSAYATLRGRLASIGRSDAEAYFDLAVTAWITPLRKLRDDVGPAYDEHLPELADDYRRILASMQFSFDLNREPARILRMDAAGLEREYGSADVETVLAHNANRAAFFTIDMMAARHCEPDRYRKLVESGIADVARRSSMVFQDMHIIGNALATGAREAAVDDITNEVFTAANRLLADMDPSLIPDRLRELPDPGRDGVLIATLARTRAARAVAPEARPETRPETRPEPRERHPDGDDPASDLALLITLSEAERHCFHRWLRLRGEAAEMLRKAGAWYDAGSLLAANDRQLVLHLAYKGSI